MNDAEILLNLVEREPSCDVYAACLVDCLIEERGMIPSEAKRHVARVRADATTAADIAFTVDLLARRGTAWHGLLQEVESRAKLWGVESFTLYVVGGADEPSLMTPDSLVRYAPAGAPLSVRLPATWVRTWHERTRLPLGRELKENAHRPRRHLVRRPEK